MTDLPREPLALLSFAPTGGSGRVAWSLAGALAADGVEVHLCAPEPVPPAPAGVRLHGVSVPEHPLFRAPPDFAALAAVLVRLHESAGLRLVHAHYALPHAAAALLADRLLGGGRLRLVTTLHGTDATLVGGDPALRGLVRALLTASSAVTAVSRALARAARTGLGYRGPLEIVPDFVPDELLACRPEPKWPQRAGGPRRLVHLGSFRAEKRVADLVEALGLLAARLPIEAELLGDGPERPLAAARVSELGLGDRIRVPGRTADPLPHLLKADLCIFSSRTESFGLGLLEALATGVPVVGPDVGGVSEVLGDPPAGRLVPPGRPAAVADAAEELLTDAAAYERVQARARVRASRFALPRVLPRYVEIYARVLAAGAKNE